MLVASISFTSEMAALVRSGSKTQTRRLKYKGWRVGDVLRVHEPFPLVVGSAFSGFSIRITGIRQELLDDISTKDAKAEGFATRDEFFEYFQKCYPDVETVYTPVFVIEFEVVK